MPTVTSADSQESGTATRASSFFNRLSGLRPGELLLEQGEVAQVHIGVAV